MKRLMILSVLVALLVAPGCATAQRGGDVIGGAAVGAAAGAAGGAVVGKPGKGAAVGVVAGAVVGLLSGGVFGSSEPCSGESGEAYRACTEGFYQENSERAYRRGLCEGVGGRGCYRRSRGGYYGGVYTYGPVVPIDQPMVMPWPMNNHHHYRGCGHW